MLGDLSLPLSISGRLGPCGTQGGARRGGQRGHGEGARKPPARGKPPPLPPPPPPPLPDLERNHSNIVNTAASVATIVLPIPPSGALQLHEQAVTKPFTGSDLLNRGSDAANLDELPKVTITEDADEVILRGSPGPHSAPSHYLHLGCGCDHPHSDEHLL